MVICTKPGFVIQKLSQEKLHIIIFPLLYYIEKQLLFLSLRLGRNILCHKCYVPEYQEIMRMQNIFSFLKAAVGKRPHSPG